MKENHPSPKQGDVFLAEVSFSDFSVTKRRPIVVIATDVDDEDVSAIFVTSSQVRTRYDVVIEFWEIAGLAKPSVARTSKFLTIHPSRFIRRLGELHPHDWERVIASCRNYLG